MENNTNGRARLGGRALPGGQPMNDIVKRCWHDTCRCPQPWVEEDFLRDFYPWSMDDAFWLLRQGMTFQ
jgi:hypothetical protein